MIASSFRRRSDRPAIVGHRGVRGPLPENTMAAFARAIDARADAVELDVRLSRDGVVVVCHDPDLARVAGDRRLVADLDARELGKVDLGHGQTIPLLGDVLDLCRAAGIGVNVELKRDVPSRPAAVIAAARLLGARRDVDVVVSSFDPWMLGAFGALQPRIPRAQLVHRSGYVPAHLVAGRAMRAIGLHLEASLWTAERVAGLRRVHAWMAAWTVLDVAEARRLDALGVDAIITDDPGALRAHFDRR
jgi:glycerophosphoryl diester phosphodiesterase